MTPIDISTFGVQIAMIAAVAWALTQVAKGTLGQLDPRQINLIFAAVLGVLGYLSGYLAGNWFEVLCQVILAAVAAPALHEYGYRAKHSADTIVVEERIVGPDGELVGDASSGWRD